MGLLVPPGTVREVVAVVAEDLISFTEVRGGSDGQNTAESRMGEVAEAGVGEERVVDLVGEGGRVGGGGATLNGDVQDLLLLLVQADLVRVVVPVLEGLKWKK